MASVNRVILIGNLGKDPEVRYAPSGDAICNVTLATSESWKDKQSGEKREATEWHRVIFFGKLGEIAGQYLKKGSPIYVEGSLRTRKWQDKDGVERYTTEIRGDEMKMLGGKGDGQQEGQPRQQAPQQRQQEGQPRQQAPQQRQQPAQQPAPQQQGQPAGGAWSEMDDDIPFNLHAPGGQWRVI